MSQVPQPQVKNKNVVIKHHKLGDIKLGKIPNNEKCRMIIQLLQEKQAQSKQLNLANALFNEMSQRVLNTAKGKLEVKIKAENEARLKIQKEQEKIDKKNARSGKNRTTK